MSIHSILKTELNTTLGIKHEFNCFWLWVWFLMEKTVGALYTEFPFQQKLFSTIQLIAKTVPHFTDKYNF